MLQRLEELQAPPALQDWFVQRRWSKDRSDALRSWGPGFLPLTLGLLVNQAVASAKASEKSLWSRLLGRDVHGDESFSIQRLESLSRLLPAFLLLDALQDAFTTATEVKSRSLWGVEREERWGHYDQRLLIEEGELNLWML